MLQDELAKALDISKGYLSKLIAKGCPADDVGKARLWIRGNTKPRASGKASAADPGSEAAKDIPPVESPTPDDLYSWEKRLERARRMEVQIYNASKLAVDRREYGQLQSLLASYQRALQGIAEAEKTALQTRIQSGELIHRDTARAILIEVLKPLRDALDLLPITERSRCNPADPKTAEDALRGWKDSLMMRLSQAETKF